MSHRSRLLLALPLLVLCAHPLSAAEQVAAPAFSVGHGFFTAPIALAMTCDTAGASIRYRLDGGVPTASTGTPYSGPLAISGTTVVRAAAFAGDLPASRVTTRTYVFPADVVRQAADGGAPPGWPATWGANAVDYGMDPEVVDHPDYAATVVADLQTIPSLSVVMDLADLFDPLTGIYANAAQDGRDWERPASLELLVPGGGQGFQIDAGIRIRGGFSRAAGNPKHSFRMFFRAEYGAAKLRFPLVGTAGADEFDAIDLRTAQNYSWSSSPFDGHVSFLHDQFSRDTQLAMGRPAERGDHYHLYLDGQYWGLYNTCERAEASYAETYLGGREEDYDVVKVEPFPELFLAATDGTLDAWNELVGQSEAGVADDAAFLRLQGRAADGRRDAALPALVDVPNLIDYMLLIFYTGNFDAPVTRFLADDRPNNFYALRDRTGAQGFRFVAHDSEHTLVATDEDRTGPFPAGGGAPEYSNPQRLFQQLEANAEFRRQVGDHVRRHFFGQGALTPAAASARFLARAALIDRAVVGESARWGDAVRPQPYLHEDWAREIMILDTFYLPYRTGIVLDQLRARGLYPAVPAPEFSLPGGDIVPGAVLAITRPGTSGTIHCTIDGSDPRVPFSGAVAPGTLQGAASLALPLDGTILVKARVEDGGAWSALTEALFRAPQDLSALRITEIMYHPLAGNDEAATFEFIELKNTGATVLDLSGARFEDGIDYTFPPGSLIAPGGFVVVPADELRFAERYARWLERQYAGRLSDAGERVSLVAADGTPIAVAVWGDDAPWPEAADGDGYSLVPRDPAARADPLRPDSWRASTAPGGSPGRDDPEPTAPPPGAPAAASGTGGCGGGGGVAALCLALFAAGRLGGTRGRRP